MKRKFIINIFIALLLTVAIVSALHYYFLRSERMRLIDHDLETTASALISSDLSHLPLDDFEEAEDYLHEVLGTKKIAKIILLKNVDGSTVYSNSNAVFLSDDMPVLSDWSTIKSGNHTIRVLSIPVAGRPQFLQVGVILDREQSYWKMLDLRFVGYCLLIALVVLVISYLLASQLLSPLRQLALYLDHVTTQMATANPIIHNVEGILPSSRSPDEFSRLVGAVNRLLDKIKLNAKTFQGWTALMAHELKTPMTILRNQLEEAKSKEGIQEVERMGKLINSFLEWSSLENEVKAPQDIHAVSLESVVKACVARFPKVQAERVDVKVFAPATIFATPTHVEQIVQNLIENALKYSPVENNVYVEIHDNYLKVLDCGEGIPQSVIDKLGEPFNFQKQHGVKGTGLGLAMVSTLCKKYGWKFTPQKEEGKFCARLDFVS